MSSPMCRITCGVHHSISGHLVKILRDLNPPSVLIESCRNVRQVESPRPFGLPGTRTRLDDSPGDRLYITAEQDSAQEIMEALIRAGEMELPGHGSITIQNLASFTGGNIVHAPSPPGKQELSQITCILSSPGAGEYIAGIALDLGTGVPTVTLGIGTGIRDRLGLLRVTIPPEKELVHLVVPSHDAEGIIQLLVENGRLNRPGGGFIYQTPVGKALLDTRMRIGSQEHAASIEQIIAALDDLRGSTAWRKRFVEPRKHNFRLMKNNKEITASCTEGYADKLVSAAMKAGAKGATISRVQHIGSEITGGESSAWERVTSLVPSKISMKVADSLAEVQSGNTSIFGFIEVLDAPAAYSYGF